MTNGKNGVLKNLTHLGMFPNLRICAETLDLIIAQAKNQQTKALFTVHSAEAWDIYSRRVGALGLSDRVEFCLELKEGTVITQGVPVVLDTRHTTLVSQASISFKDKPTIKQVILPDGVQSVSAIHFQEVTRILRVTDSQDGELAATLNGADTVMKKRFLQFWKLARDANGGVYPKVILEHSFPFVQQITDPNSIAETVLRTNDLINNLTGRD